MRRRRLRDQLLPRHPAAVPLPGQWTATWEDLGADSQSEFRDQCENDWARTRADLEPREVRLAVEACEEASDMLLEMQGCDELRALYLD